MKPEITNRPCPCDGAVAKAYKNGYRTYGNKHGQLGLRRKGREYIGVCSQLVQGKNSTYVAVVINELWREFVKKFNLTTSINNRLPSFKAQILDHVIQ